MLLADTWRGEKEGTKTGRVPRPFSWYLLHVTLQPDL